MTSDERRRAAYSDLTQAAAIVDRHGSQLSEDPEMATHFRVVRSRLAVLIDRLSDLVDAYRPDYRQAEWQPRFPWDRLP